MASRKTSSTRSRLSLLSAKTADTYTLYEAAVQSPEANIHMIERVFQHRRKRKIRSIREDFSGTARLCCEWVRQDPKISAWAIDLDDDVQNWCREHHFPHIQNENPRVHLICDDVRSAQTPLVDTLIAFNFSFYIFKTRPELLEYLRFTRANLVSDGLLFLDLFAGPDSYQDTIEERQVVDAVTFAGQKIPLFTYRWQQAKFNHLNHHMMCSIHFSFPDGTHLDHAFRYNWRIWTPAELTDLLHEAGYQHVHFYLQSWNDRHNVADNTFRRRTFYNDFGSWFGYLVAEA